MIICFYTLVTIRTTKFPARLSQLQQYCVARALGPSIPRKIWQTWKDPSMDIRDDEFRKWSASWTHLNPDHRYELLTDHAAKSYVSESYRHRSDIVSTFERIDDRILHADFLRYLAILADGGVYADIDTECTRPVRTWIPSEFVQSVGCVIGIEYNASAGPLEDFKGNLSLCQWTFMARPWHPVMQQVVDSVTHMLQQQTSADQRNTAGLGADIGELTGPAIFTKAILKTLSSTSANNFDVAEIMQLTTPKLFGDVLFLPISAFGSGQSHSGSKDWGNEEQLVSHHFRMTWRAEHGVGWR
ncbi:hypothetical protein LTR75_018088 [Friedmanniomyces endolithicus]|nr:hypothetical protein LTR75_018088 [Friedmanniomyces endolithicus]